MHNAARRAALLVVSLLAIAPSCAAAGVIAAGPRDCPGVALTFDLCPVRGGGFDQALVDYLVAQRIPATFFVSGRWVARHDAELRQLLAVPFFEIGTHGDVHAHLPAQSGDVLAREIGAPVALLQQRYGRRTTLFRPPYGEFNDDTVRAVAQQRLRFILWDAVSGDPDPAIPAAQIEKGLRRQIRAGSIVVMHANGKGRHTREVVTNLHRQLLPQIGLVPMTVSELLDCKAPGP